MLDWLAPNPTSTGTDRSLIRWHGAGDALMRPAVSEPGRSSLPGRGAVAAILATVPADPGRAAALARLQDCSKPGVEARPEVDRHWAIGGRSRSGSWGNRSDRDSSATGVVGVALAAEDAAEPSSERGGVDRDPAVRQFTSMRSVRLDWEPGRKPGPCRSTLIEASAATLGSDSRRSSRTRLITRRSLPGGVDPLSGRPRAQAGQASAPS